MGNAAQKAAKPAAAAARTYPKTVVAKAADVTAKSERLKAAAARVQSCRSTLNHFEDLTQLAVGC